MSVSLAVIGPAGTPVPPGGLLLIPAENLRTGVSDFKAIYSGCTSLEEDVLRLASGIYACDLAFKRGEREDITRNIELTVPVVNHQAFERLRTDLELLLWVLSADNWSITFVRPDGQPEAKQNWPTKAGATILFSGGADSFVGAVELLNQRGATAVQLASHVTGNPVTRRSQDDLADHLVKRFGTIKRVTIRTGGRTKGAHTFPSDSEREDTQRTRSFMFLAIASLAARRSGHDELVVIAENGQMAIHVPLSPARIGAFSTHTAHPEFVRRTTRFFSQVLDAKFTISNPYLYLTKAEVIGRLATPDRTALSKSVSCWRGARVSGLDHCGECVPCLVRRIAFEHNGITLSEYKRDLLNENVSALDENDEGKRNLVELAEFVYAFGTQSDAAVKELFPDLINEDFDFTNALSMYRRFAKEADIVLRKYSGPAALLPPSPTTVMGPAPKRSRK